MPIRIKKTQLDEIGRHNWAHQGARPFHDVGVLWSGTTQQQSTFDAFNGGIAVVKFYPMYGYSVDKNSALNVAAAQCYDFARSLDNSIAQYDSYEWFKYALAGNALRVVDSLIKRKFMTYDQYSALNLAIGDLMFSALRISANDKANISNLKLQWFELHSRAKSLHFIKEFDAATQHSYICENIFADDTNVKTQYYLFEPAFLYYWDIMGASPSGSIIAAKTINGVDITQADITGLISVMGYLLGEYCADDDCKDIAQSNIRLVEKGVVTEMEWSDEIPSFQTLFDANMLDQLHSAEFFALAQGTNVGMFSIDQNLNVGPGLITGRDNSNVFDGNICLTNTRLNNSTQTPVYQCFLPKGYIVFSHDNSPTAEQNVVLTRFVPVMRKGTRSSSSAQYLTVRACGTEIISEITLWYLLRDQAGNLVNTYFTQIYQYCSDYSVRYHQWTSLPYLWRGLASSGQFTGSLEIVTGDLDNMTTFSPDELESIHEIVTRAALTSMLPLDKKE